MSELLNICQEAYHPVPQTGHIGSQAEWKAKLDACSYFCKIEDITSPAAFKFEKDVNGLVVCFIKQSMSHHEWRNAPRSFGGELDTSTLHTFFTELL